MSLQIRGDEPPRAFEGIVESKPGPRRCDYCGDAERTDVIGKLLPSGKPSKAKDMTREFSSLSFSILKGMAVCKACAVAVAECRYSAAGAKHENDQMALGIALVDSKPLKRFMLRKTKKGKKSGV